MNRTSFLRTAYAVMPGFARLCTVGSESGIWVNMVALVFAPLILVV